MGNDTQKQIDQQINKINKIKNCVIDQNLSKSHLSQNKHKQREFFIADIFEPVSFKDEMASMEHPLFALKAGDTKERIYINGNVTIKISPTAAGIATIHDKDIWIYCISKLRQGIFEGKSPSQIVRFTIYDYLITTNKSTNNLYYIRTKQALDRLAGTRLTMEWETKTHRAAKGIGLIDSWNVVEEKDGQMVRVEVKLPDWLYDSILDPKNLLTISPDYFRLRKPIDRRIYEIARKHCGRQRKFSIVLEKLYKKTGATSSLKEFKRAMKSLAASNELPGYHVYFEADDEVITFIKHWEEEGEERENNTKLVST